MCSPAKGQRATRCVAALCPAERECALTRSGVTCGLMRTITSLCGIANTPSSKEKQIDTCGMNWFLFVIYTYMHIYIYMAVSISFTC